LELQFCDRFYAVDEKMTRNGCKTARGDTKNKNKVVPSIFRKF
jgi:hypothetical protein